MLPACAVLENARDDCKMGAVVEGFKECGNVSDELARCPCADCVIAPLKVELLVVGAKDFIVPLEIQTW